MLVSHALLVHSQTTSMTRMYDLQTTANSTTLQMLVIPSSTFLAFHFGSLHISLTYDSLNLIPQPFKWLSLLPHITTTILKAHSKYFCTSVHINISSQQLQRQIHHPWFNVSQLPRAYKFKNYIHHKDWHTPNFREGVHTPCSCLERITKDACICYTVLQGEIEARPETQVQWSNLCNFECEGPGWNVRAKGYLKEWRVSWAVARWQWAVAVAHGRWHSLSLYGYPGGLPRVYCHVVPCSSSWCVGREESN